jgi:hypothetical protein
MKSQYHLICEQAINEILLRAKIFT